MCSTFSTWLCARLSSHFCSLMRGSCPRFSLRLLLIERSETYIINYNRMYILYNKIRRLGKNCEDKPEQNCVWYRGKDELYTWPNLGQASLCKPWRCRSGFFDSRHRREGGEREREVRQWQRWRAVMVADRGKERNRKKKQPIEEGHNYVSVFWWCPLLQVGNAGGFLQCTFRSAGGKSEPARRRKCSCIMQFR